MSKLLQYIGKRLKNQGVVFAYDPISKRHAVFVDKLEYPLWVEDYQVEGLKKDFGSDGTTSEKIPL